MQEILPFKGVKIQKKMKKLLSETTAVKNVVKFKNRNAKIYLNNILANLPENFFWTDLNGVVLGCNDNQAKLFGLNSAFDLIGKNIYDIAEMLGWDKNIADAVRKNDLEVIHTCKPIKEEETAFFDGKLRTFLSFKNPLLDEKNHVIGVFGVTVDITERKELEESLKCAKEKAEAANLAKTEFLENMRHDIRTPLTGIVGFANLIKEEAGNEKMNQYADNLIVASNALLDFMNYILETIRLESDEAFILKNKFNLEKLLQSIIDINKAKAAKEGLKLELIYDKNIPPYLLGDARKIYIIIHELVTNALNFTHKGGVKICVTMEGKNSNLDNKEIIIKFTVEDTGIGIPKEKVNDIFIQFSRVNPTYEGIYKGLGLGLSNVKKFVYMLEGEIYVESILQKGSVFTCLIPLKKPLLDDTVGVIDIQNIQHSSKAKQKCITDKALVESPSQSSVDLSSILLVEDSEVAILYTETLLSSLGCVVDIAKSGKEALIKAKTKRYDFIFMDVGLPDLNGDCVTYLIREFEIPLHRHTPIVALTAHTEKENEEKCIKAGMDAVISKPISKETASDILDAFIPKRFLKRKEI